MRRSGFLCLLMLLLAGGTLTLSLNGCGNTPDPGKIQHIIVIVQENRTPDNLFQDPALIAKGADIASSGINSSGNKIPLTPAPLGAYYDLSHQHSAFVAMYDG